MKIIDYGTHMNEDLQPVMVLTVEIPLMLDFYMPDELRTQLDEFFRQERERKKDGQSA
jgi:hypothetical protein